MENDIQKRYSSPSPVLWRNWGIRYKLIVCGFLSFIFIIVVIGFYALNASEKITKYFEGGVKEFRSIVIAATEASSYAKRAEGHLMLYLALHREADKPKFPKRIASLQEQISILDQRVRNPEARSIFDQISSSAIEILPLGNALIDAHDKAMEKTGEFDIEKYQEKILKLHDIFSATRKYGVELANFNVKLEDNIKLVATTNAKRLRHNLLIVVIGGVIFALVFGYILFKIVDNINKEVLDRKQAEEALRENEEKYRLLIKNIPSVVYKGYKDWSVEFIDKKFELLTGYDVDEFNSKKMKWSDIIVKEDIETAKNIFIKALKADKSYVREYRIRSKDGGILWIQERGHIVLDKKGKIESVSGVFFDITERKQAEEQVKTSLKEKKVLLREIHHRVKNNMQVITSLLRLRADKIEDKKYANMFKEGEDQIRSMALIHEQFYQSKDFANIDFGEYIKSLTNALFTSHGIDKNKIKLNIEIRDVSFDLENAIPCGLIINELVSNSLKYAFPQGREGKISIALRSFNEDGLELTVNDDGVGIPEDLDIRNTESMGLNLVTILAEGQLDGKIDLDRTEGTQFRIKFKRAEYKPRI